MSACNCPCDTHPEGGCSCGCDCGDTPALIPEIASLRAEVARLRQEVLAEEYVHGDTQTLLVKEGAAVKRLEREVARLTEERDAANANARTWFGPNGPEEMDPDEVLRRRWVAAGDMARLAVERDASRALADRLAEALRTVEFSYRGPTLRENPPASQWSMCPDCGRTRSEGHEGGCAVTAALREWEEARRG